MTTAPPPSGHPARPRRHDPERRQRIIQACLDVIAERGVAGVSHRLVAAAADVNIVVVAAREHPRLRGASALVGAPILGARPLA